jgi:hypothetical protein
LADLATLHLQDFSAFEAFGEISRLTGVEITLHGGVAFRAALHAAYHDKLDVDLFDLAPFSSDIDLEHSGSPKETIKIAHHIESLVPFASWCRWSINSAKHAELASAQRKASTDIPLRRIRFSTSTAAHIPEDALVDIKKRQISFKRNRHFGHSRPDLRPDLELFGLMLALNSRAEAEDIVGANIAFDEKIAHQWLQEGLDQNALELIERPEVAARFWHLLSTRLARCGFDDFNSQLIRIGSPALRRFGISTRHLLMLDRAICVSRITASGAFRVPEITPEIVMGSASAALFEKIIWRAAKLADYPQDALPHDPMDLIDPSLELVGIVSGITLLPYNSDSGSSEDDPFRSSGEWEIVKPEFVEFAWKVDWRKKITPHALTGQMLVFGAMDLGAATALPVVGGVFEQPRAWIRVRLDDLIERGKNGIPVEAALLILQAQTAETGDVERGPKLRRSSIPENAMGEDQSIPADNYAHNTQPTEIDEPTHLTVEI